jgi:CheY-like chemotaxis protein
MEKIMIVDDNKDFSRELGEMLSLCGYEPKLVCDSPAALAAARKIKPDVILLDLRMSKMNGFEVAQQLKQSKETSGIPIIAMSGYFPIERRAVLLDLSNMKGQIKKPFTVSDLINQIEGVLN